jgi:hypothetical protein
MSYGFSTGRVETSPVQNDSGSVSVAILDHCAGLRPAVLRHPCAASQPEPGERVLRQCIWV